MYVSVVCLVMFLVIVWLRRCSVIFWIMWGFFVSKLVVWLGLFLRRRDGLCWRLWVIGLVIWLWIFWVIWVLEGYFICLRSLIIVLFWILWRLLLRGILLWVFICFWGMIYKLMGNFKCGMMFIVDKFKVDKVLFFEIVVGCVRYMKYSCG